MQNSAPVWIVIAAHNEAPRIQNTLAGLRAASKDWQVVVVDDGSSDDTAAQAARFEINVIRHPINCGQGAALQTGIDFALSRGANFIVTFDADNQHDPDEIASMLAPVVSGQADVAIGSRFIGRAVRMPLARRLMLIVATWYTRLITRMKVTDTHNGFRAFSGFAARKIRIHQPRMAHASEILEEIARHRLKWQEVPVTIRYSQETLAKGQSGWDALRILGQLAVGRMLR